MIELKEIIPMIIDGKFYGRIQQENLLGTWRCPWCLYQMSPQYLRVSDKRGEIEWSDLKPLCRGNLVKWDKKLKKDYTERCNRSMNYTERGIVTLGEDHTYENIKSFIEDHKENLF